MAKVRKYTLAWGVPPEPNDIQTIRIRCKASPFNAQDPSDPENYAGPFDDVGKVSQCDLPLPNTPLIDGDLSIALSSVDDVGNESDQVFLTVPFDLIAPAPPIGPHML